MRAEPPLGREDCSRADCGRAAVIEEGISALAFDYARRHRMLEGVGRLDFQLLRTIKDMTSHLEVSRRTTGEWWRRERKGLYCPEITLRQN